MQRIEVTMLRALSHIIEVEALIDEHEQRTLLLYQHNHGRGPVVFCVAT